MAPRGLVAVAAATLLLSGCTQPVGDWKTEFASDIRTVEWQADDPVIALEAPGGFSIHRISAVDAKARWSVYVADVSTVALYGAPDGGVVVSGSQGSSKPLVILRIDGDGEITDRFLLNDSVVVGVTDDGRIVQVHDGEIVVARGSIFTAADRWAPDDATCEVRRAMVASQTVTAVSECGPVSRATVLTLDGFHTVREWESDAIETYMTTVVANDLVSVGFDGQFGVFGETGEEVYEGEGTLASLCRIGSTVLVQTQETLDALDEEGNVVWSVPEGASTERPVCLENVLVTTRSDDLLRFGTLLVVRDASSGAVESVDWRPEASIQRAVGRGSSLLLAHSDSAEMVGGIGDVGTSSAPPPAKALSVEDVERITGETGYTVLERESNELDVARGAWRADFVPADPSGAFVSLAVLPLESDSEARSACTRLHPGGT